MTELHKDLGITSFTYDTQGNILKESNPKGITSFEYNALGQQTKVTTYEGNTLINRYDAEGLRAEIEGNQKLTRFIFHRDEILVETDENDAPISRFARGYDVVAGDVAGDEQQETKRYYYQQDEQFSTSFITNNSGKVENHYTYDAFGNTLESQENVRNRIKYTGQQYDPVTEQYYLRARFYNPILGRFMQEDVYRGDGLNLYAYCENNPVMYYDPSGYAGETTATAMGKKVHKERADQRRQSGKYDTVNEKMRDSSGEVIQVPKRVDKSGKASRKTQSSIPDAVKGPDKGGIIIDDKPAGRSISKDKQEMRRNIEAYEKKYGELPNEIIIDRYDPKTGKGAGTESYKPEDFTNKKNNTKKEKGETGKC